jgi:hypothetical protein
MGQKQTTTTSSSVVSQKDKVTSIVNLTKVNKNSFEFHYVVGKGGFGKVIQ